MREGGGEGSAGDQLFPPTTRVARYLNSRSSLERISIVSKNRNHSLSLSFPSNSIVRSERNGVSFFYRIVQSSLRDLARTLVQEAIRNWHGSMTRLTLTNRGLALLSSLNAKSGGRRLVNRPISADGTRLPGNPREILSLSLSLYRSFLSSLFKSIWYLVKRNKLIR